MTNVNKQTYFSFQEQNKIIRLKFLYEARTWVMEPRVKHPDSAQRALALRVYCGFEGHGKQKEFARWLGPGVTAARWGMVERGQTPFSHRMYEILKRGRLSWIEWDWLRFGIEGKMPLNHERPLLQILAKLRNGTTLEA